MMTQIICQHKDRYNIYCTVSDGFRFVSSIDLDQLKAVIELEQGIDGLFKLTGRILRSAKNGHSSTSGESLDDFLCCNRAGEDESKLSTDECIDRFLS